jgi:hypothetical protein
MPVSSDRGAENVRPANPRVGRITPGDERRSTRQAIEKKHPPLPSSAFVIEPESPRVTVAEEKSQACG